MHIKGKKERSPLIVFGGWFLIAFITLSIAWGYVVPAYNWAVASIASPLFRMVESDNVTAVHADGSKLLIGRHATDGAIQPFLYFDPYIYFGLIPLIALLISVPGPGMFRRLQRTLIGVALLFIVHITYLIGSVELTYVAVGLHAVGATSKHVLDWTQILLRILWQVSPVLIAVLLSMGFWRDRLLTFHRPAKSGETRTRHELTPTEGMEGERP